MIVCKPSTAKVVKGKSIDGLTKRKIRIDQEGNMINVHNKWEIVMVTTKMKLNK
ncbi:hypothetical protein Ancab_014512, partial [Ancistrocladus abbreviatus]